MYLGQSSNSPVPCVGKFQLSAGLADRVWAYEFRVKHPEGPGPGSSWSGPYAHETDYGEIYDSFYFIPKDTLRQLIDQALALPHSDYDGRPFPGPMPITNATISRLGTELQCGMAPGVLFTPPQVQSWFQTIGLPPGGPEARSPAPPPAAGTGSPPGSNRIKFLSDDLSVLWLGLAAAAFYLFKR